MKRNKKILISLIIMQVFLSGCSDNVFRSPEKYVAYLKKNEENVSDSVNVNGLIISAKYIPVEYLALNSQGVEKFKTNREELLNNYAGMEYFECNFWLPDQKTSEYLKSNYKQKDAIDFDTYFNFSIQQDVRLIIEKDTLPCNYLHREISDAITNRIKYTIAFRVEKSDHAPVFDRIIFIDSDQFGLNNILLHISAEEIEALPQLKIK